MSPSTGFVVVLAAVASVAGLLAWRATLPAGRPELRDVGRAVAVYNAGHRPADQVISSMEASDRARARFSVGDGEGAHQLVARELASVEVSEAERVAWYDAHRDLFGARDLDASREVVDELVRIEKLRAELGGAL